MSKKINGYKVSGNTNWRGYKVFDPNWKCNGFQFKCPGTFKEKGFPKLCVQGFHFCLKLEDCFTYYDFDKNNKVAEIIAFGDIDYNFSDSADTKCCTNKIRIVKEISWEEVLQIVNHGKKCNGIGNYGNENHGNFNVGSFNYGSRNTGDYNHGDSNIGSCNDGYSNSGYFNRGDYNSGKFNIGSRNSGDFNKTSFSSGCFMTHEQPFYMFNKPTSWTFNDWVLSPAYNILGDMPTIRGWEELEQHEETGAGQCVTRQEWWDSLPLSKQFDVISLPNFDSKIFKQITGIKVHKKEIIKAMQIIEKSDYVIRGI